MRKLFLTGAAIALLAASSAYAEVNVDVNLGLPGVQEAPSSPVYVSPSPVIVEQRPLIVNDPHHREQDRRYWEERKERERREREAREHHDHQPNAHDHNDHGGHNVQNHDNNHNNHDDQYHR